MVTRGVKTLLKKTTPGNVGTCRGRKCYKTSEGKVLRGITKILATKLFSSGTFPESAIEGDGRGGCWRGRGGGRRRGSAVDAQVSRLINGSKTARKTARMLKLTQLVFKTLQLNHLEPLVAQRIVHNGRLGTAVDFICQRGADELVVMEMKTGFAGDRDAAAREAGRACFMSAPVCKAKDSQYNRHCAQLAVGLALFKDETNTLTKLRQKGIKKVTGGLLYVNNNRSSLYYLPHYWHKRDSRIVAALN